MQGTEVCCPEPCDCIVLELAHSTTAKASNDQQLLSVHLHPSSGEAGEFLQGSRPVSSRPANKILQRKKEREGEEEGGREEGKKGGGGKQQQKPPEDAGCPVLQRIPYLPAVNYHYKEKKCNL